MNQFTFLVLFLVMQLEGDVPNVHLDVLETGASFMWGVISAVGLGHGSERSYYSKAFSVHLTFSAQFCPIKFGVLLCFLAIPISYFYG